MRQEQGAEKYISNVSGILNYNIHLASPYFSHLISIAKEVSKEAVTNLKIMEKTLNEQVA